MGEDSRANKKNPAVVEYRNPGVALPVRDALPEVLRNGARELLQQAIETEVASSSHNIGSCRRKVSDNE